MPQIRPTVNWVRNTHLPAPPIEPVRIDNSDVTIENDKMEEEKSQRLQTIHLQQHRVFLDQQQEIKQARKHANKYKRFKSVIAPENREKNSCSMLVRRTRSYNYINSKQSDDEAMNVTRSQLGRSYSWSYVSVPEKPTWWGTENTSLPSIPFASQPIKMRHIPSVKYTPEMMTNKVYKGKVNISPNYFQRQRTKILNKDCNNALVGRSYKTLKELSDINKLSEAGNQEVRGKILTAKRQIIGMYNETLKDKMCSFHRDMDRFKVDNGATPVHCLETLHNPPIIY